LGNLFLKNFWETFSMDFHGWIFMDYHGFAMDFSMDSVVIYLDFHGFGGGWMDFHGWMVI